MSAQDLYKHELSELRGCETGPWEFRRALMEELVENPFQDGRLL